MTTLKTDYFEIDLQAPIIKDGFDEDEQGVKWARFKHQGDFILTIKGKLENLPKLESIMTS